MSLGPWIAEFDAALNGKKKWENFAYLFDIYLFFAKLISRVLEIKVHKGAKRVDCRQMGSTSVIKPALAKTSCKTTWDTVSYFGINGMSMILRLWSPLHPLSKLIAIQDHTQNLEEQLWMGGRRKVSIISHRPMNRSDLKQERSFFRGSVSTFLQLVVWVLHTPIAVVHVY